MAAAEVAADRVIACKKGVPQQIGTPFSAFLSNMLVEELKAPATERDALFPCHLYVPTSSNESLVKADDFSTRPRL